MNKLYLKGKECLGKDMSATQDSLGCVEALSAVFKLATGQELGENLSTIRLYNRLLADRRFQRIIEPEIGSIILSPTNGQNIGHTGIVSDNGKIMSNNSILDIWDEHLDLATWKKRYASFPIVFFRYQFPAEPAIITADIEQKKISILKQIVAIYQTLILMIMKQKFGALSSSQNPEKLSLTIKSIVAGLLPVIHLISGVEILGENADKVIDAVFLLITTGMTIYGYIRAKK